MMTKHIKKAVALILAIITLMSCTLAASVAFAAGAGTVPTVYIKGQGHTLVQTAGDKSSPVIYPFDVDLVSYALPLIEELNPIFAKAYITGDYTEYCKFLCNAVEPVFAPIQIDKSGEVTDGSGSTFSWPAERLVDKKKNGEYTIEDYDFWYDWRVDPCITADLLNDYIEEVKQVTGAPKVNIVSRCLGCNIVLAYLHEYGSDSVAKCVLYCAVTEGTSAVSKLFSGQIAVDPDDAERYAYDKLGGDALMEFLGASVALLNRTNGLDLATDFVEDVYEKVKPEVTPKLIRMTYGGFPTYWSMCAAEDYEAARDFVFGDCKEEYAGLIERIDYYHYNIQRKACDILSEAKANGVDMAVIAKYGYQLTPVANNSREIGDGIVEIRLASFGATASSVTDTFSAYYLKKAEKNGTAKYISSDKQVDASTCLFPDYTWIIKGIEHRDFPDSIDELINAFLKFDGQMTVEDDPLYPQYLFYNEDDGLSPLGKDNDTKNNWNEGGFFAVVLEFIAKLGKLIKEYLVPMIMEKIPSTRG